ncbi:MAG: hypothetical protein WBN04_19575 [Paracoccaceae bacterium]
MDRTDEEIDDLKSLLAVARKRAINFAVCLGQNHDATVFAMHRRKSPDVLGRKVKKDGETTKIATGEARLKAKTLTLTCLEPPPPGAARQLRLYFRDFGLPFKIDIHQHDGAPLESDGQDDGEDAAEILRRTTPKPDKKAAKWASVLPAFDAAVAKAVAADSPKAGAIQAAWDGAKSAAAQGRYKTALAVAKKIKPLLAGTPAPTAPTPPKPAPKSDPNAQKWAAIETRLQGQLAKVLASAPGNADKLQTAMDMARQKAAGGDYKTAILIAKKLAAALGNVPVAPAQPANPRDLSAWTTAHDALAARLQDIGRAFDTARLAKRLRAARNDVERAPEEAPNGLATAQEIDRNLTAAGKAYFATAKSESTAALATIQTYRGGAGHLARLTARIAKIDAAYRRTPPDFGEIHAAHAAILAARADLRPLSDRFEADYNEWITKKANWCDTPLAKLTDPLVSGKKAEILASLALAERKLNEGALTPAKRLITDAYWDIKAAQDLVEAKAGLAEIKASAVAALGQLSGKLTPNLQAEFATLKADIDQAAAKEAAQDFYTAALILKPIPAQVAALLARPAPDPLPQRLKTLTNAAAALAENAHPDAAINELLGAAQSADPATAGAALDKAETLIARAEILAAAAAGKAPSPDALRRLAATPEGGQTLDALIAEIPDAAMPQVLAARFKLDVKPAGSPGTAAQAPAPDLRKLYSVLAETPGRTARQTRDMLTFDPVDRTREKDRDYTTSPGPVFHQGASGAVHTSAFNPFGQKLAALSDPNQLGRIDPDCISTTTSSGDNPAYGRWAALHQIGQAINRRKKFMQSNGNKKDFGGWQVHGADVSGIAQTVARHFGIERAFVERAMSGAEPKLPATPQDLIDAKGAEAAAAHWQKPHDTFLDWLNNAGPARKIWTSDACTAAHKIGGRVIHQAAPGNWVSYDFAARSKGVTGSQFRSPDDWFAELYAAYFTNVLHPSHPARDWLTKL